MRAFPSITAFSIMLGFTAGCFASPPPPPAGSDGPHPTLTELLAQIEGKACVWIRGRRYPPGEAPRVIRHPEQNCRIDAAREIAKLGPRGADATPTLLAVLPEIADQDTGDGWLMVRTAVLDALAAVADNPAAIPALVDATRSSGHGTGSAAASRALVLGYDAKADLDLAAAAALAGSTKRLPAIRQLTAFDDPRGDEALIAWLLETPTDGEVWRLAEDRAVRDVAGLREALREACASPDPAPDWRKQRACSHASSD